MSSDGKYKKKVIDQSPEIFRKSYENEGIVVDWDHVSGFISEVERSPYTGVSKENAKVVSALLMEMIQAAKYGQGWDQYKKRIGVKKIMEKKFDPSLATTNDPAFCIVTGYLRKKYTYKETIDLFNQHVCPASDRQIERWIDAIRPRAEKTIQFVDKLIAATDTE